jgi:protein-S-isoprenylcysteine O-methyltransferase Ste14
MKRTAMLAYGVAGYVLFLVSFLYAIGFVGNLVVPKSIDSGPADGGLGAWIVNALLLGLFAVQHSTMARLGFKRWWTRVIPRAAERSTFVLITSLLLLLLFWQWRPMPSHVWSVEGPVARGVLHGLFWIGWGIVLVSTFLINHFDLFGLRQVWLYATGREYSPVPFVTRGPYKVMRHPLMFGFLVAFWATPDMSAGHLLFSILTTGYIVVGTKLEERDLMLLHPEHYAEYAKETSMLLPIRRSAKTA